QFRFCASSGSVSPSLSLHDALPIFDARSVELELLDGLTDSQMLGTPRHFVEPPIWEMGHVGWFQELWVLRHLDSAPSLLPGSDRSEEHTSELQSRGHLVCRLLLEKK